jgi:2'-5' RNA ligase
MQKYVLVKLLEQLEPGAEFAAKDWPLHITLVSNFAVDRLTTRLDQRLENLMNTHNPIPATAGGEALFGADETVRVTVLEENASLSALHKATVDLLRNLGAQFDEPRYLEAGYRAHATVRPQARLNQADTILIDEITLIDMYPRNDISRRKVLRTFQLKA